MAPPPHRPHPRRAGGRGRLKNAPSLAGLAGGLACLLNLLVFALRHEPVMRAAYRLIGQGTSHDLTQAGARLEHAEQIRRLHARLAYALAVPTLGFAIAGMLTPS